MTHAIALPLPSALAALTDLQRVAFGYLADYEGKTRQAYEYHLNAYITWCQIHQVDPLTADRTTVALYIRHLSEERGLRGSTVNTCMTPVKGFYKWAICADRRRGCRPGSGARSARAEAARRPRHTRRWRARRAWWRARPRSHP